MKKSVIYPLVIIVAVLSACTSDGASEKSARRVIKFDNTPDKRPYSPAIEAGNMLFVSGQIGVDQATGKLAEGGIEAETHQVLKNLKNVIEKAGYGMGDVVKCTVLLNDIAFYSTVNQIYMEYFTVDPPARMAFAVKALPMGALIEIDAIAVK